jgi:hypothetical protein
MLSVENELRLLGCICFLMEICYAEVSEVLQILQLHKNVENAQILTLPFDGKRRRSNSGYNINATEPHHAYATC